MRRRADPAVGLLEAEPAVAGAFTLEANRDVFFPLFAAAQSGAAIDLYPNVAIAFPRSPMHIAYQAWDLQRISRGRFALGLGSQIRSVRELLTRLLGGHVAARPSRAHDADRLHLRAGRQFTFIPPELTV